ncbi:MAG: hypothetical protein ABIH69_00935 [bacterium]|nr:hypothetical protein [Candidatus Margulisiibacteriota bacterium]
MKNKKFLNLSFVICSLVIALAIVGCGKDEGGGGGGGDSAGRNPTVTASELFDVSGATAIATASSNEVSVSDIRASAGATVTELLRITGSGEIASVLTAALTNSWHPPISLIETGPDGSLYIGFQWSLWVRNEAGVELDAAFFKITPAGVVSIVDDAIYGVGTWYGDSNNGELPVKQLQFDSAGNLYYLGRSSSGSTILKKKTVAGVISQIGNNRMEVRDFLVTPDGFVLFHGSNSGSWSTEWLRVYTDASTSVDNIFYNDGGTGWLRSYYYHTIGTTNYVYLIGENLTLLDGIRSRNVSGIVKVSLNSAGVASGMEVLYDDNNMYSNDYGTIGEQLVWGYWDDINQENKKFFTYDEYGNINVPLVLADGVTEEAIKVYIRNKFQNIVASTLEAVTFAGTNTNETYSTSWDMSRILNDLVGANITGTTWKNWKEENGLNSVRFGNAKQLLFPDNGNLYAVLKLDTWNSGSAKGDKLFLIVNEYGTLETTGFPQDTATYYTSMSKAKAYDNYDDNYVVYLGSKGGRYKIFRLDLRYPTLAPVDLTGGIDDYEIFSFSFDAVTSTLYYDVYDMSNNTSYMVEQLITSTTTSAAIAADGYTITEVVPFAAD